MNTPTDPNTLAQYNNIKGSALFFRAYMFYLLSGEYSKPFVGQSASSDLGIVLRLSSDPGQKVTRSTVQQTYNQMIKDIQTAIPLLSITSSVSYQTRPTRPAAYALLAKIYLAMSDYKNALTASSNSLNEYSTLLDFNSTQVVPGGLTTTFPNYSANPELVFWAYGGADGRQVLGPFYNNKYTTVNIDLYNSYDDNDLRKTVFYSRKSTGGFYFSSNYVNQKFYDFAGIATNEVLLIHAECAARVGDANAALTDLNALLIKRYKTGTFTPLTINDPQALITKILLERRKELPFTGIVRWEDLRRLNQDPKYAVTLTRVYQGQTYTLKPNDQRYVLPIPDAEIQLTGIQQNPR
jgi:starch-binding outer membrane protein, SusD/RagB family